MLRRVYPKQVVVKPTHGQAMVEFTFCMIIILLMIYAIMMVLHWTGADLAERRVAHEQQLRAGVVEDYGECIAMGLLGMCLVYNNNFPDGPLNQIDPYFYTPVKINAVWGD